MIQTLAILGPGTLGRSLAGWAARCGLRVRLAGRDLAHAAAGVQRIHAGWGREADRGRLSRETLGDLGGRLQPCATLEEALDGADAFVEALPEDASLKQDLWRGLTLPAGTLPLTASSALPLAGLRPAEAGLLLGFHLFMPVDRMALVELVTPMEVDEDAVRQAEALGRQLQKRVIRVRDQPGYAASRMALAQGLEAIRLLARGTASARDLDDLMRLGYGHPVGPLELTDRIGLDLRLAIAEGIWAAEGDPRFEPPDLLRKLVAEGYLGRATGQGFYRWTPEREDA